MTKQRQWHVKRAAIIAPREGGYWIDRKRLGEIRDDGILNWPMHLAEKDWVDLADFERAFRLAVKDTIPADLVERSFAAARLRKEECKRFSEKVEAAYPGRTFITAAELLAVRPD